jgi:hypothetical protein
LAARFSITKKDQENLHVDNRRRQTLSTKIVQNVVEPELEGKALILIDPDGSYIYISTEEGIALEFECPLTK